MNTFLTYLENTLKALVTLAIGLMLCIIFMQVITRYAFDFTPSFGEELSRYLFVWIVFLSLPLVAKTGGHMAIETLTSRIQGFPLKLCRIAADLFSITFLSIMTIQGIRMVQIQNFQTSAALRIPMSWVYVVIPFGCAVMLLYVVLHLIETVRTPADAFTKECGS